MIIKRNKQHNWFYEFDLENKSLLVVPPPTIMSKPCVLIKNAQKENIFNNFITFAKQFGKYLDYDNKPYFSFDEISQQEISYHTDGVSCLDYKRIPKYLPLIGLGTILPIHALQGGS